MSISNPTLAHFRHFSSLFTLSPLYICRESSTNQLLFMQNKPNLLNAQTNVSSFITKDYENERLYRHGKNKPNQTQFQTFCWGCHTEKIMFCNRLNGKCQLKIPPIASSTATKQSPRVIPSGAKRSRGIY